MQNKRILISGAGIAGLALGNWLHRHGFEPTIIERADSLRGGGYMIDFWGAGPEIARRMGILSELERVRCEIPALGLVDERNEIKSKVRIHRLREMTGLTHFNLLRSDLERVLARQLENRVEIRFATSIADVRASDQSVEVQFTNQTTETFDLVVGADGLHSNTRRQVFGPDDEYERYLGYYTASFTIDNYLGKNDLFLSHTLPEKQVGIYSLAHNRLAAFFLFGEPEQLRFRNVDEAQDKLRDAFQGVGWQAPELLERMTAASDFYLDAVSHVRMPVWTKGRIALTGDACQCASAIAGHGPALAMAGAYVLAGELRRADGDYTRAFSRYWALLKPAAARNQRLARRLASSFVPSSLPGLPDKVRLMFLPTVSRYFISQYLSDGVELETY